MIKFPLEMIEWADAESEATWVTESDMDSWCEGVSIATDIGWVYQENDETIVLVTSFFGDGTFGNRTKIPKGMVRSRKRLCISRKK
jgi:hypothetical protein